MKDKEWLKEEIWKQDIVMDKGYIYTDDLMSIINEVDEPEIKQLDKKIRELESYNDELIRDNNQLRRTIDSQESLSQEWIDENKVARIDNLRKMTTSDVVPVEKLKKLIVPKQDKPVIPQFVADWIESQDDPIYEMCVNYEMWGVNGDDGTTRFTGELAEWFDDTLNVENYYRACIDGYEVEKEKLYRIKFSENQYASRFNDGKINSVLTDEELAAQYTEAEIKAIDKRYWPFAEEVTE